MMFVEAASNDVTLWLSCIVGNVGARFWKANTLGHIIGEGIKKWFNSILQRYIAFFSTHLHFFQNLAPTLPTMQLSHWGCLSDDMQLVLGPQREDFPFTAVLLLWLQSEQITVSQHTPGYNWHYFITSYLQDKREWTECFTSSFVRLCCLIANRCFLLNCQALISREWNKVTFCCTGSENPI